MSTESLGFLISISLVLALVATLWVIPKLDRRTRQRYGAGSPDSKPRSGDQPS